MVRVRQAIHLHRHVAADEYDVVFAPTFSTEVAALATLRERIRLPILVDADTGFAHGVHVRATHSLSLLTLNEERLRQI